MERISVFEGIAAPLKRSNVDTDQIIPAVYLKRITKTGFEDGLFASWRQDPEFVLNQPAFQGAAVLIAGPDFGTGSSREHAVWALSDYGFRAVLAPSFADIFYSNCFKNGLLPIPLSEEVIETIFDRQSSNPGYQLTVDLENCIVSDSHGLRESFSIEPSRQYNLLHGLDDIGLTLQHEDKITAYEKARGIC